MRAIVVDHSAPHHVALRDGPDVVAGDAQVLIRVEAFAVNFGELPNERTPSGHIPGWEAAGVVEQSPDVPGAPAVGARVVTWGPSGSWAQRRVAELDETTVVPDGVELADATTLPVAALTAFRALRAAGSVLGRTVLVTGGAGGVGGFAVQLAALGGAHVTAVVSDPAQAQALYELGASEVVTSAVETSRSADVVLDNVGGPGLAEVIGRLAVEGQVLLIGAASWQPTQLEPMALTMKRARLIGFQKGPRTAADLAVLLALVAEGKLKTRIVWRGDWTRIDDVLEGYRQRTIKGKGGPGRQLTPRATASATPPAATSCAGCSPGCASPPGR